MDHPVADGDEVLLRHPVLDPAEQQVEGDDVVGYCQGLIDENRPPDVRRGEAAGVEADPVQRSLPDPAGLVCGQIE